MLIEIGSLFKHRETGLEVIIKDITYSARGQVVWFVFKEDDDYFPQHYTRTTREFISKFSIILTENAKETLNALICQFGHEAVLNHVGETYKNILRKKD